MASPPSHPLPQPTFPHVDSSTGVPTQPFAQYLADLDATVRQLTSLMLGSPVQLVNAASDTAAAAAGVKIGQLYRSGNTVHIRVT